MAQHGDADFNKGAVEQDRPSQETNTSLQGQLPHRNENPNIKSHDTDYPERGETPEHSGEAHGKSLLQADRGCEPKRRENPEGGVTEDQERQKRNQGGKKDDPLAA